MPSLQRAEYVKDYYKYEIVNFALRQLQPIVIQTNARFALPINLTRACASFGEENATFLFHCLYFIIPT